MLWELSEGLSEAVELPSLSGTSVPTQPRQAASTHLAVAHVAVAGQADRGAVRLEQAVPAGACRFERVQGRRLRHVHRIVLVIVPARAREAEERGGGKKKHSHPVSKALIRHAQKIRTAVSMLEGRAACGPPQQMCSEGQTPQERHPTPNPPFSLALPQAIKHDDQQGRLTARDGGVRRQAEGLGALGGSLRQALPILLVPQRGLMAALAFRCHGTAEPAGEASPRDCAAGRNVAALVAAVVARRANVRVAVAAPAPRWTAFTYGVDQHAGAKPLSDHAPDHSEATDERRRGRGTLSRQPRCLIFTRARPSASARVCREI